MNENVDWNFANNNLSVSGPAFTNHTGPANSIGSFYGLAIRKRKTQERQAHLSDESTIKPLLWGSFKILWKPSHQFCSCVLWGNSNGPPGEMLLWDLSQWPPLPLHLHLRKGEECWQAERGWSQRVEWWVITRKKNRSLLPFIRASIKYCLAQVHFVPFCFLCKCNI